MEHIPSILPKGIVKRTIRKFSADECEELRRTEDLLFVERLSGSES